jgi:hypothetical protein
VRFHQRSDDGLRQPWTASNWMNSPFERAIARFGNRARHDIDIDESACRSVAFFVTGSNAQFRTFKTNSRSTVSKTSPKSERILED